MNRRRREHARRPAGSNANRPLVAIVGRPNVGKSTLFKRLAGQHVAIVEDIPGVTRDRHYADAHALGREFVLIDTGGFDPDSDDPMKAGITAQVRLALDECDVVICVVDATVDPLPADREAVALLRDAGKPVIFVGNKVDSKPKEHDVVTYYELGISSIMPISALHGRGIGDLEEEIAKDRQLGVFNRGDHAHIGTVPGKKLDNAYSLNTVDVCPVGALTSSVFRFSSTGS